MMRKRRTSNFRRLIFGAALLTACGALALAAVGCGGDAKTAPATATSGSAPAPATSTISDPPGANERGILRGTMTLDGAPMAAEFLGARVTRDGLTTACQFAIPDVMQGRYEVQVVSDAEVRGCGAPGAQVLLWVFTKGQFFYSERTAAWPGSGGAATFDATFSSSAPNGATKPVTEMKGRVFDRAGNQRGGRVIEAFVGDLRCAVSSTRYGSDADHFYTLIVAGPEYITGCAQGATLSFRVDGTPMPQTAVNDLSQGGQGQELNFTVD